MSENQREAAAATGTGGGVLGAAGQGFGPAPGQGFDPDAGERGLGMSPGMGVTSIGGGYGATAAHGIYGVGFAQMPQYPVGMGLYGASSDHPAGPCHHGS